MIGTEDIVIRLKETTGRGSLVLPLPDIFHGPCLSCGTVTSSILNYLVLNNEFGMIVSHCLRKNPKNFDAQKYYAIPICSEDCLRKEIDLVSECILEEITR